VEANAVFTVLTPEELARVNVVYDFHYWNEETHTVRFVTTYGTKEEEMDRLVSLLA
jgi:threonine aldolase